MSEALTTVITSPSDRLRHLQAAYVEAKRRADEAAEQLKAVTDGIKAELVLQAPEADRVTLPADGLAPALRLARVESWRIDTAKLKAEQLETYVRYAKKSTSWTLRTITAGDDT